MTNSIHGHKVLDLLTDNPLSCDDLRGLLASKYGDDAQYFTCQLSGLDFDALWAFFVKANKVTESAGKYTTNLTQRCDHD